MARQPETPRIYGAELKTRRQAVLVPQGVEDLVELTVYTPEGEPYDLSEYDAAIVRFSEAILSSQVLAEAEVSIVSPQDGYIRFHVPSEISSVPGLYLASIGFKQSDKLKDVYRLWIYVEPSAWGDNANQTLPQIDELRTYLRDSSPIENELLDSYQYFLTDICEAILKTVQFWNNHPPYQNWRTTQSFNYPAIMRMGIEVFLIESILEWARKNRFPYQAGGVASDDMARFDRYEQILQIKKQEFYESVLRAKAIESIAGGFSRIA